ncbi:MAG: MotA/TolQ/ExbB proton channel family protein [Deltaproteobacteria bacterium]|nr:MotA/TolQ/ExbB proton channel family protein [Deltaproteobacteria bacterium]
MLSHLFLGMSLVGAEWVLYILIILSVISVAIMFERAFFYKAASRNVNVIKNDIRIAITQSKLPDRLDNAFKVIKVHTKSNQYEQNMGLHVSFVLLNFIKDKSYSVEVLNQIAQDAMIQTKILWDKNLAILATIGNNAPFVGLFGTVLGIIRAFHDLSQQVGTGVQTVTAGVAEALIATAIGILVAIPAVVAFNLFQKRVKTAQLEAEALKSFIIGQMANYGN